MGITTASDYERALSIARLVLRSWDPYSLVAGGAPADEFDSEAAELVRHARTFRSAEDAVRAVSAVFSRSFDARGFEEESCGRPGRMLFQELRAAGLLNSDGA
ncbi:MAG: DUF1871 family protein [Acidobacteria bacterium]|nr:MAG: DUF1871 family protein [Acidobacteriota bacterium]REK08524.1 MAG: DUF1871 family protein [Acidobacteriota bacterium]